MYWAGDNLVKNIGDSASRLCIMRDVYGYDIDSTVGV